MKSNDAAKDYFSNIALKGDGCFGLKSNITLKGDGCLFGSNRILH
jgi:hypothetical protein